MTQHEHGLKSQTPCGMLCTEAERAHHLAHEHDFDGECELRFAQVDEPVNKGGGGVHAGRCGCGNRKDKRAEACDRCREIESTLHHMHRVVSDPRQSDM